MKLAISGKGGVGKTTLAAALAIQFAREGRRVFAVDADPDSNLAATLGFPDPAAITPLSELRDLIRERVGERGGLFTLNPRVDDIPERYCPEWQGVRLAVIGTVRSAGSGCMCPESTFVRALLRHLVVHGTDVVIADMEAGVEHLGRGTAAGVDALVVVVQPIRTSVQTALRIRDLAGGLGIRGVWAVGNRVAGPEDGDWLQRNLAGLELLGHLGHDDDLARARGTLVMSPRLEADVAAIRGALVERVAALRGPAGG
jgi:CO dehydrogenase maturation factor